MRIYTGLVIGLTVSLLSPGLAASENDVVRSILANRRYLTPSRGDGFLEVDPAQVVMNPVFTKFSFQTWTSADPLIPSALTSAPWGSGANAPYADGAYGDLELDHMPPTVQASLRLMHSAQRELTPEDILLPISPLSAEAMHDQGQMLSDQLLELDGKLNAVNGDVGEMYTVENNRARLHNLDRLVRNNENQIEFIKTRIREAGRAVNDAQLAQAEEQRELDQARQNAFWCTHNYLPWMCGWSTAPVNEAFQEAEHHLDFLRHEELRWKTEAERLGLVVRGLKADARNLNQQIQFISTAHDTSMSLRDRELIKQNRRTLLAGLAKLSAFVHDEPRGLRASAELLKCANPLHYQGWAGYEFPRHPLFPEDVDLALVPHPEFDLWVCPTKDNHLASVHILQGTEEIYHSVIHRGASQAIDEIKIYDLRAALVEDHVWAKTAPEVVRYGISFRANPASARMTSIYTEISAGN